MRVVLLLIGLAACSSSSSGHPWRPEDREEHRELPAPAVSAPAPAAPTYSCFNYYNKLASATETECKPAASCPAAQAETARSEVASNVTTCAAAASVWCFPYSGNEACMPSHAQCDTRRRAVAFLRESVVQGDLVCVERH